MDRPHDERLATTHVAGGKDAVAAGLVVGPGLEVATGIELEAELGDRPLLLRADESHCQQSELAGPFLFAAGHVSELELPAPRIGVPLDADGLEGLELPLFVAEKLLGEDAPFPPAAFLVGGARAQNHRPLWPRRARRPLLAARVVADIRRLGKELELHQRLRPLAVARAVAIAAGVAAADHDHVLAGRGELPLDFIPGVALVLLREEIHRVVHPLQLAAGDRQITPERRAARQQQRVVVLRELLGGDVLADVHSAAELDPLLLHLPNAPPDAGLLELEVGDAVHEQAAGPIGAFEDRDQMPGAIQLLRGSQPRRTAPHHGHALPGPLRRGLGHDPALLEGPVGDRHLDLFDGDRIGVDAEHTGRLARRRADAPRELGEVVGGVEALGGLVPLAAVHEVVEVRDDVPEWTTGVAEGHAAVHAARPLLGHLIRGEDREKLVVVLEAVGHRLLAGDLALVFHESACFTHGSSPPPCGPLPVLFPVISEARAAPACSRSASP